MIGGEIDSKTVVFFLKIGKVWRKSLMRGKRARACEAREKKTDCPFSIQ